MNETFRRYLLGRAGEVEAVTSGPPSTWDAVRKPVLAAGTGVAILLLVSQQELFSATTAVVTALGTGAATISKLTGLFDRRAPGGRDA
jgi:electron transfer flavoprotein alpha/beta subunit